MNYELYLQSQQTEQQPQNDSQPAGASPMQGSAPGTDDHMQAENESDPESSIQLNGAASNKIESNGQSNADQVTAGLKSALAEPINNDQPHSNASAVVAAAATPVSSVAATAAATITTTQPPPQQNPTIQPLMNMPIQPQGPPAQIQSQFNTPPPFAGFGMPPPNYMYPPWSMPWQQPLPQQQIANDKSRIIDPQVK